MKKTIITVLVLALYCAVSNGQDTCRNDYRITTLPFQFIFNDYNLTFEKAFKNRRTIGLTIGYRPSTKNEAEISSWGLFGSYTLQNFWNPLYNAFTIGLNSKYYFSKSNKMFIDGNIFYRLWWFDKKKCFYDNIEEGMLSGIRTERQNVYGTKILIGNTLLFNPNKNINPLIDIYLGVGLRYKMCRFETFDGTFQGQYYSPYNLENRNFWLPSLHFGLRIGLEWKNIGKHK